MALRVGYFEVGQAENLETSWVTLHLAKDSNVIGTSCELEADDAIELGHKLITYGKAARKAAQDEVEE